MPVSDTMLGMGRPTGASHLPFLSVALALLLSVFPACRRELDKLGPPPASLPPAWSALLKSISEDFQPGPTTLADGEALSLTHCAACHLRPVPTELPRASWLEVFQSLQYMFTVTGILEGTEAPAHGTGAVAGPQNNLGLPSPATRSHRISRNVFAQIAYFYFAKAPLESLPQQNKPAMTAGAAPFQLRFAMPISEAAYLAAGPIGQPAAATGQTRGMPGALFTLAAFDRVQKRIVLGELGSRSLHILDPGGRYLWSIPVGEGFPTSFTRRPDGLYVISSSASGNLLRFPAAVLAKKPAANSATVIIPGLNYPVHAVFADLDGDKTDEVIVEEFGPSTGVLSWFMKIGTQYKRNILYEGEGSLATFVNDFNGDGRADVASLVSQEVEAVILHENQGGGRFEGRTLAKQQPAFGSDAMVWADFNKDGHLDFMTVNGDNDLQTAPLRNYHGVRVWRNDGQNRFQQDYFYPMYGTLQAVTRDFDGDGDLDIVAVAPFPDMKAAEFETAVYLENTGGLHFTPRRIGGAETWPWCVLDAGDFDGDGDDDLILAAWYHPPRLGEWQKISGRGKPLAYAVFENTTANRK